MDAKEYKHLLLGLYLLKYITRVFDERYYELAVGGKSNPEDKKHYIDIGFFWVPESARWEVIESNADHFTIGRIIDDAIAQIEKYNPSIRNILPKNYGGDSIDKTRIGQLVQRMARLAQYPPYNKREVWRKMYEKYVDGFAQAEGRESSQFYTPRTVAELMIEILEPRKGIIYDPCCGTGTIFVEAQKFFQRYRTKTEKIVIYGQEVDQAMWRICKMSLAFGQTDSHIVWNRQGSLHKDLHKDLKADYIVSHPPFNDSEWGLESPRQNSMWKYGIPPQYNGNFAWMQHIISHLSTKGVAGVVLDKTSLLSTRSNQGNIRSSIVEADLVDCIIGLPGKLFYDKKISPCFWFLSRDKNSLRYKDRRGETLFIDARKFGKLDDAGQRLFSTKDIAVLSDTYHAWRSREKYRDVEGFCRSASLDEIRGQGFILDPIRYTKSRKSA